MLWLLPFVVALAASAASVTRIVTVRDVEARLKAPDRRIRALHPTIGLLIARGVKQSLTFATLVRDLERTDLIVYVEAERLPASLSGRMLMIPTDSRQRFVRIQVRTDCSPEEIISTIAHELRHALEVAEHADVRDVKALEDLYKRIGTPVSGGRGFDTDAAQTAGRTVRRELAS
jgi:hypothetical protein